MKLPELINYIDGSTSTPTVDRHHSLCNANTAEPIQSQLSCDAEQVEQALSAADRAYKSGEWEHTPAAERADILDKIADELANPEVADTISYADSITTGAIIRTTRKMAAIVPMVFRGAAQFIREGGLDHKVPGPKGEVEYFKRPWGPSLLISPWNGPTAIGSHKIASALAAGAPAIMKPSEWAPHSAIVMAAAIHRAGLPAGTFQLTLGNRTIGSPMVADPRIKSVSFTGGLAGGRAIARACADDFKPTQLELGGNNALVAFEDADIEKTATGIVFGMTNLNAQWCRALGRLVVHESIKEALLDAVLDKLSRIRLGDSLSEDSEMGPMVHDGQYKANLQAIDDLVAKGGVALSSTPLPQLNGYFIAPTLIDNCKPEDTIEEVFGPVAAVHTFSTDAEALALANGTPFGLAGYVYSENEQRAFAFAREMRTGGVKINGYSLLSLSGSAPRSAWGLSGLGEEGHSQSIEFFTGARVVGISPQDPLGGR
ncbi:aldehyde dehydrogenase [Oceanicoccus sp. KOV_DT_Chl]|uniref:aldehyde dehydrogenase family protein n=1 Tax=Oceanicoccus sp. KOV_DT_Chl TaxID=1904639 RepID=UPI000C7B12E0|nr:aldehyde dehydrogenase family protein [Oceanicoccus sp. KOV_DT_Chl]